MKFLVGLGHILVIVIVSYFIYLTIMSPSILSVFKFSWINAQTLFCSVIIYMFAFFIGSLVWFVLLRSVKEKINFINILGIVMQSQAAKYIPGNVAHHIGRVILAKKQGIGITNTIFTMAMETLWVLVIAGLVAVTALLTADSGTFKSIPNIPQWWIFLGLAFTAMILPLIGHRIFNRLINWWLNRKGITFKLIKMPSVSTFFLIGLLYILNYLIFGVVLQIIVTFMFNQHADLLLMTGIFAVAWVVGFITPGAPAGVGVREAVLVAALTPLYGNEVAIGISALLRLVTILGDGFAFLIGLFLVKTIKPLNIN